MMNAYLSIDVTRLKMSLLQGLPSVPGFTSGRSWSDLLVFVATDSYTPFG